MKPKSALLMTAAILLIVANMVEEDGKVDQIAAMEGDEIRSASASTISQMTGFTPEDELGPQESVTDRAEVADDASAPQIGDFNAQDLAPASPGTERARRPVQNNTGLRPGEVDLDFNPTIG